MCLQYFFLLCFVTIWRFHILSFTVVDCYPVFAFKIFNTLKCAIPLLPTFLLSVPPLVAIWSYPGQATTRQPGILCGWFSHLELSATGHSFGSYIITFKNMLKTSFLTFLIMTDFSIIQAATIV